MGTWAEGSFGNDAAGDWIIVLAANPAFDFIRATIQASIDNPDDATANAEAVAGAEVLCILDGRIPADYEDVSHNLGSAIIALSNDDVPADLKKLAIECLDVIATDSGLKDLWEGSEAWETEIANLRMRLVDKYL